MNKELDLVNKTWNNLEECRNILMQKGIDISFMFDDFNELKQALTSPTADEIVKELTPRYKKFYPSFIKIEITKTGIYAIRDTVVEGKEKKWVIFSMHGGIVGNRVCSHLTLKQINMCSTYFMSLEEK